MGPFGEIAAVCGAFGNGGRALAEAVGRIRWIQLQSSYDERKHCIVKCCVCVWQKFGYHLAYNRLFFILLNVAFVLTLILVYYHFSLKRLAIYT